MDSMDVIPINATEGERAIECLCEIVRRLKDCICLVYLVYRHLVC